jgi:hypothetical protein
LNPHEQSSLDPKSSASASSATLAAYGLRGNRTPDPVIKSHLLYLAELAALYNDFNRLQTIINDLCFRGYGFGYKTC